MSAGNATINLQLTLGDQPPPPHRACQVRLQPRRPSPSRLRPRERRAEARTAAENAAGAPEADASEATDNSELRTAAVNAADATETATVKKPTGRRSDGTSEKEVKARAFKKPPEDRWV